MARATPSPLPDLTPDRLLDRIAEALRVAMNAGEINAFPAWTRRVMRILKSQFIPSEFEAILATDASIFAEGIAVAWAAKAQDLVRARTNSGAGFARQLAERLSLDAKTREVAMQVESGTFGGGQEFQSHVMMRLFAEDFAERRAFAEGLAVGNRLPELIDRQAKRSTTDATAIYLLLWFYWPEISQRASVREVADALEPFFAANKNMAGSHWDERIRKLANRIGLSFRVKQSRARKRALPRG
jgi:hypothetical protein